MIMPIDIDKKEFSRDKRGYNSREVDEFLDRIIVDYEKVLNDNRNMAHKIKYLEKQLEESQKSDTAMLDTLETAKKLMADISASAERRAELMMRDAELESDNMILEAKNTVRRMNDEHLVLKHKVERLRANFRQMLESELSKLDNDDYGLLPDLDRSDIPDIDKELSSDNSDTVVVKKKANDRGTIANNLKPQIDKALADKSDSKTQIVNLDKEGAKPATVDDLSEDLKKMAGEKQKADDTVILRK